MEALLHFVWSRKLGKLSTPQDSDYHKLEVIEPGVYNRHAGPDFLEAKVKIDGILWIGAVEIHCHEEEWYKHQHEEDPAYNGVILHVVGQVGKRRATTNEGRSLSTAQLSYPSELERHAQSLIQETNALACTPMGIEIPSELAIPELERLAQSRLLDKAKQITQLWQVTQDWYETLYIILARSFGFGLNSDSLESLARSLPLSYIKKQSHNPLQVEAMLLGQARLIERLPESSYRTELAQEYQYLQRKYNLKPAEHLSWRMAKTRPQSSPLRRIIQLSTLLRSTQISVDSWARVSTPQEAHQAFIQEMPSPYWLAGGATIKLSKQAREVLILNLMLPLQIAFAEHQCHRDEALSQALTIAKAMPSESNHHIRLFESLGIRPRQASDGQALIQRYQKYCKARRCLSCHWGQYILCKLIEHD